jgi:hypothetical protein
MERSIKQNGERGYKVSVPKSVIEESGFSVGEKLYCCCGDGMLVYRRIRNQGWVLLGEYNVLEVGYEVFLTLPVAYIKTFRLKLGQKVDVTCSEKGVIMVKVVGA